MRTLWHLAALILAITLTADCAHAQEISPEQLRALQNLMNQAGEPTQPPAEMPAAQPANPEAGVSELQGDRGDRSSANGREVRTRRPNEEFVLRPGDTLVLTLRPKAARDAEEDARERLLKKAQQWLKDNPYKLDHNGRLLLLGIAPIPLAGLTPSEATMRVQVDPAFQDYNVDLALLPVEPTGADALKMFGYDIFKTTAGRLSQDSLPAPAGYVVGVGDVFDLQLFGATTARHVVTVNRDGQINVPRLGPVSVSGMKFDDVRAMIERRVSQELTGADVSISLRELRSMTVFVMGEVEQPGSYAIPSFGTVMTSLYAANGVTQIGSLRNVQVRRGGALIANVDLYDLLLRGNNAGDVQLSAGDVVFVPPLSISAAVVGEVRRAAIYEIRKTDTVADLIALAGGLLPTADSSAGRLERTADESPVVLDVSLRAGAPTRLQAGDVLHVLAVRPVIKQSVALSGHFFNPGRVQYRAGMRLSDVVTSRELMQPGADVNYLLIRRQPLVNGELTVISADLEAALRAPRSSADPLIVEGDEIVGFSAGTDRRRFLDPLLGELRLRSSKSSPARVVYVGGQIKAPGEYPLEENMTVRGLVRAAGGLTESALAGEAELIRFEVVDGTRRESSRRVIDLTGVVNGTGEDLLLRPHDQLVVKEISEWERRDTVTITGEVAFPGEYPIEPSESLRSLIQRAGGLSARAFPRGAVFMRRELREREQRNLEALSSRMQRDLATLALQASQGSAQSAQQASQSLAIGQSLMADLRQSRAVGRLVIDIDAVLAAPAGSEADLSLRAGDRLVIPKRSQEVTVMGEVPNATSHIWKSRYSVEDYIRDSGGIRKQADEDGIYIIKADGSITGELSEGWFASSQNIRVEPGDTIVVPLDTERIPMLPLWTSVTTVIYNLAVSVAAIAGL